MVQQTIHAHARFPRWKLTHPHIIATKNNPPNRKGNMQHNILQILTELLIEEAQKAIKTGNYGNPHDYEIENIELIKTEPHIVFEITDWNEMSTDPRRIHQVSMIDTIDMYLRVFSNGILHSFFDKYPHLLNPQQNSK